MAVRGERILWFVESPIGSPVMGATGSQSTAFVRGGILATGMFLSFAYFYQAGGWNQNSRFDLVRAIIEEGTLRIDDYHHNTGDKARWNGHYYSDKAPGLALAAVPVAAALKSGLGDPARPGYTIWLSYVLTVVLAALPTAVAAWLLYGVARKLGAGEGGAAVAALVYGLGTPAWAYATLLFGHALATCLVIAAFSAALALSDDKGAQRDILIAGWLGVAAGWAAITEYPTAVPAILLGGYALAEVWPGGWLRRVRVGAAVVAGALLPLGVFVLYNQAAFGSPFTIGYTHEEGFPAMQQGFMGVTYPNARALWGILVGGHRGLFFHAPAILIGLVGFLLLVRGERARAGVVALGLVIYFTLFNSAYAYWDGGWSYGPRHMAPALPFLCLPLGVLWSRARPAWRVALGGLAAGSLAITLIAVSTTVQPPEVIRHPLPDLLWPAFLDGDLSLNHQSFLEFSADVQKLRGHVVSHDAWNLGEKLGLSGLTSLLPLGAVWLACAVLYVRAGSLMHPVILAHDHDAALRAAH